MRILAIRGQNIASLAERFEIDFNAEPLHSAGLFAITGETGAGKSSILDAMCLALYGDCPRLSAGGANEDVPDSSGDALKAKDARAVLRRGAPVGQAEVDFVGIDGECYRATWAARRARGRVDGRLQNVERSIIRVSDGQPLDTQITLVNARVQAVTGLTYDEFRRTVLLAQGDFDAFLRADTNDRAALLEKVTGTQIYRDISIRVYERMEQANATYQTLITRRDEHRLLPEEERAALADERARLAGEADQAKARLDAVDFDLRRHGELNDARARHTAAADAFEAARRIYEGASADRDELARIDRADPLRMPFEGLRKAQADFDAAGQERVDADGAFAKAAGEAEIRSAAQIRAVEALDEVERVFKEFGPIWTHATRLDGQISTARSEAGRAAGLASDAVEAVAKARSAVDGLCSSRVEAIARQTAAKEWLDGQAPLEPISKAWDRLERALAQRVAKRGELAQSDAETKRLDGELANVGADIAAIDSADADEKNQRGTLDEEARRLSEQRVDLEGKDPAGRAGLMSDFLGLLGELSRAAADYDTAVAEGDEARTRLDGAESGRAAAMELVGAASLDINSAEAKASALAAPVDRALAAVSHSARELRLRLVEGEPCPVCGSAEHPIHADETLAALARSLQGDLKAARDQAQDARMRLGDAQAAVASADANARAAEEQIGSAGRKRDGASDSYAKARDGLGAIDDAPDLPSAPAGSGVAIQAAIEQVSATRDEMLEMLQCVLVLNGKIARITDDRGRLTAAIEQRAKQRDKLVEQAGLAEKAKAVAGQIVISAGQELQTLDAELAPALAAGGLALGDLDSDPDAVRCSLAEKVAEWTAENSALAAAEKELDHLRGEIREAETRLGGLEQTALLAANEMRDREGDLARLTAERAELLGGELTEPHRSRINEQRTAAQGALNTAQTALREAENTKSAAAQAQAGAERRLAETRAERESADTVLQASLASTGFSIDDLITLFARPEPQTAALRGRLREIDRVLTAATVAVQQRVSDLQGAEAAGIPNTSLDELQAMRTALDAQQTDRLKEIGAIGGRLDADDATRANLVDLEAGIEVARAELDVWRAVNAAVGSRNGDRFARLAQSVTLDLLVDRANHHLADLKPRYRLRRAGQELALHVVDLDMGDQVRSTRSLSGGERFLVSLALALALSRLGGRGGLAATLFIDEGFGSLDPESLDLAIDALETLQSQGRTVGVISHVEAMRDRIPVQIRVQRQGGGRSTVSVQGLTEAFSV